MHFIKVALSRDSELRQSSYQGKDIKPASNLSYIFQLFLASKLTAKTERQLRWSNRLVKQELSGLSQEMIYGTGRSYVLMAAHGLQPI